MPPKMGSMRDSPATMRPGNHFFCVRGGFLPFHHHVDNGRIVAGGIDGIFCPEGIARLIATSSGSFDLMAVFILRCMITGNGEMGG